MGAARTALGSPAGLGAGSWKGTLRQEPGCVPTPCPLPWNAGKSGHQDAKPLLLPRDAPASPHRGFLSSSSGRSGNHRRDGVLKSRVLIRGCAWEHPCGGSGSEGTARDGSGAGIDFSRRWEGAVRGEEFARCGGGKGRARSRARAVAGIETPEPGGNRPEKAGFGELRGERGDSSGGAGWRSGQ